MRLVLQRTDGDCGIAAVATLIERTYEDTYVEAAKVDAKRGLNGIHLAALMTIGEAMGVELRLRPALGPKRNRKRTTIMAWDDDEGLLVVTWARGSRHKVGVSHLVVLAHGVIADPADGVILPPDEYLAREKAKAGTFLELR